MHVPPPCVPPHCPRRTVKALTRLCLCLVTDFTAARVPKISTCSLSDMMSLSPADLVSKLRLLFGVIVALFAFMNFGAVVGLQVETKERREMLNLLCAPESGFTERKGGVWTWAFRQNALTGALEAPSGSAVRIAGALGFPFIRLRAALPEELFAGSVAQALGRKDGMSLSGLNESHDEHETVMAQLRRGLSCFSCAPAPRPKIVTSLDDDGAGDKLHSRLKAGPLRGQALTEAYGASLRVGSRRRFELLDYLPWSLADDLEDDSRAPEPGDPSEVAGTALVLAFMANQKVLSVTELSARVASAAAHFEGVRVAGIDRSFHSLYSLFLCMLGPDAGTLSARGKWMQTSRLWRFLLLQNAAGFWELTDSLAFALEAHNGPPPPKARARHKSIAMLGALCGKEGGELEDMADDAAEEAFDSSDGDEADAANQDDAPRVRDCPLSFACAAARRRTPPALLALKDGGPTAVPVDRIWATVLSTTVLEAFDVCYLLDDEAAEGEERTVVDAARDWLAAQGAADARVQALLDSGELAKAAHDAVAAWKKVTEHSIARLRDHDTINRNTAMTHIQRASSRVVKSLMTGHETFSIFLNPDAYIMRWQRFSACPRLLVASRAVAHAIPFAQ